MKDLPDYMKICFLALYNTVNELGYDTVKEQGVNSIPILAKKVNLHNQITVSYDNLNMGLNCVVVFSGQICVKHSWWKQLGIARRLHHLLRFILRTLGFLSRGVSFFHTLISWSLKISAMKH